MKNWRPTVVMLPTKLFVFASCSQLVFDLRRWVIISDHPGTLNGFETLLRIAIAFS